MCLLSSYVYLYFVFLVLAIPRFVVFHYFIMRTIFVWFVLTVCHSFFVGFTFIFNQSVGRIQSISQSHSINQSVASRRFIQCHTVTVRLLMLCTVVCSLSSIILIVILKVIVILIVNKPHLMTGHMIIIMIYITR